MELIYSTHNDLNKLAQCHRKCFPEALSSALGKRYCKKMLSWYLDIDKAFVFHVLNEDDCVGYCGGIINDGSLKTGSASGMMRHSVNSAILSFLQRPWLLFHRELRRKYFFFIKNLLSKIGLANFSTPAKIRDKMKKDPSVGLVVIGIIPEYRGKGVSKLLMEEFEKYAREIEIRTLKLSVLASNERAIGAYKKFGWEEDFKFKNAISMKKQL